MPDAANESDHQTPPPAPVAVIVSRYNESVTAPMLAGAIDAYTSRGGDAEALSIVAAPGAYELVALAAAAASRHKAVVCLGCVIKGETTHDEHIGRAVALGLADISVRTGVPVAFGVLTTLNADQALARADGNKGNKGAEAMLAALDAAEGIAKLMGDNLPVRHTVSLPMPDKAAGVETLRGGSA